MDVGTIGLKSKLPCNICFNMKMGNPFIENKPGSFHWAPVLNNENTVVFYPINKVKDTIDGMWVSGLPNEVVLITSGQEYVSIGQSIETN